MTKIISQKTLLSNKYFEVIENTIDFGKGITRKYNDYYRKDAMSVFPISKTYEIYLVKQYRYLLERDTIEAVAGMIDGKEDPIDAAKRELKEEVGIVAKNFKTIQSIYLSASFVKIKHHLILATDLSFEDSSPEETENTSLVKVSLDEAIEKVLSGEVNTSISMIGILGLDKMRQKGEI